MEHPGRSGLANFFTKMNAGDSVKIAYFGGSITEAGNGWRDQSFNWLQSKYPAVTLSQVNAGIGAFAPVNDVTEEQFDVLMNVNFKGAFFTIQKFLPLLNDGASIILLSSVNAFTGMPGASVYSASKAALNQLLRTASIELKRLNPASTVLALHPGTTDTQLSRPFQGNVPPGKLFSPAFAATCILALVSRHGPAQSGTFWAWDGTPIPW